MLKGIIPEKVFFEKPPGIYIAQKENKKTIKKYLQKHPFVFAAYDNGKLIWQSHSIIDGMKFKNIVIKIWRK